MKHALYEITKGIPAPAVSIKSKTNGISHLLLKMKKGESVLIPTKQMGGARNAAKRYNLVLVHQKIGTGIHTRLWYMGPRPQDATDTSVKPVVSRPRRKGKVRRKYTKRSAYWASGEAKTKMLTARKYKVRHAKLSAKAPRAQGPLFTKPE